MKVSQLQSGSLLVQLEVSPRDADFQRWQSMLWKGGPPAGPAQSPGEQLAHKYAEAWNALPPDEDHAAGVCERIEWLGWTVIEDGGVFVPVRLSSLEKFAEEDWTQTTGPRGGRVWVNKNTGRKVYGKENPGGKKKVKSDEAPKEKPKKPTVDEAHDHLKKVLAGEADPEGVHKVVAALTLPQIKELNARFGFDKLSGLKANQVELLASRALATGKQSARDQAKEQKNEPGPTADDGRGSGRDDGGPEEDGGPVEGETQGPENASGAQERTGEAKPADSRIAASEPRAVAAHDEVNRRLDRYTNFFRSRGQHHVADWLDKLRSHVNAVGPDAALAALSGGTQSESDKDGKVQYWGVGTEEANWKNMGTFMEAYLDRNGIVAVTGDTSDPDLPLVSALGKPDKYVAGDFKPTNDAFKDKLDEAKHLPGLEKSEDVETLLGKPVTHLTPEVIAKFDETYGPGKWICKCYSDEAAAGYGIFFPQRAAKIAEDARSTIWTAGSHLANYGFELGRNPDTGKVFGLVHKTGDIYQFGTPEYESVIDGDARAWAERAKAAADNEKGAMLPEGKFMVQPAFEAVGISDAERAAGKTWHEKNEGRVHLVTRPDGKVEVIPYSTWLKGGNLPVIFEDEDTKAMAQAAQEAINQLPPEARKGQVYAPDVMKTKDGYRVVELNAQGDHNGSGYLHDNHFTIDAYVSHLTGKEPAHAAFIKKLLTTKAKIDEPKGEEKKENAPPHIHTQAHGALRDILGEDFDPGDIEGLKEKLRAKLGSGETEAGPRAKIKLKAKPEMKKTPKQQQAGQPDHASRVAQAFTSLGKGQVSLAELQKASGLSREDLHAAVKDLRKRGILTGQGLEQGRAHDQAVSDAGFKDELGGTIGYVSVRDGREDEFSKLTGGG